MYELYSKRIKNEKGEPEVYIYDVFPQAFRNQMFYALSDVLDFYENNGGSGAWEALHNNFSREIGVKNLGKFHYTDRTNVETYIDRCSDVEFLDILDFAFAMLSRIRDIHLPYVSNEKKQEQVTLAFIEMNYRFKQHNLGYEFIEEKLVRKDNEHIHQNVIKPALKLLIDTGFAGAEKEFLEAFEHRRKGENKDAILDALKAFESTMKSICAGMGYPYDPAKSTAKELISILETNGFYPAYMNNHMTSLRTSLESGLPTLRNKNAGHGQGATVVDVSEEFTEYALNLAATNIVLLSKIYQAKKVNSNAH